MWSWFKSDSIIEPPVMAEEDIPTPTPLELISPDELARFKAIDQVSKHRFLGFHIPMLLDCGCKGLLKIRCINNHTQCIPCFKKQGTECDICNALNSDRVLPKVKISCHKSVDRFGNVI